jgi:hypothetical protein
MNAVPMDLFFMESGAEFGQQSITSLYLVQYPFAIGARWRVLEPCNRLKFNGYPLNRNHDIRTTEIGKDFHRFQPPRVQPNPDRSACVQALSDHITSPHWLRESAPPFMRHATRRSVRRLNPPSPQNPKIPSPGPPGPPPPPLRVCTPRTCGPYI